MNKSTLHNTITDNVAYQDAVKNFVSSGLFYKLFDETIQLVQACSDYLEGTGRVEQHKMDDKSSVYFSTESIKLTNRLMQVSSWLLALRSFFKGEEAYIRQVNLIDTDASLDIDPLDIVIAHLPVRMAALIAQSHQLYQRIIRIDEQLKDVIHQVEGVIEDKRLSVQAQQNMLQAYFA